jgi:hypothetical protein
MEPPANPERLTSEVYVAIKLHKADLAADHLHQHQQKFGYLKQNMLHCLVVFAKNSAKF